MPEHPKSSFVPVLVGVIVAVAACVSPALAIPAFSGAEGYGANSTGGRGGDVYHVTNLNDTGAGSLRYGISSATGARTIVFDVGGTILLASTLNLSKSNITIAGQTAPGQGILVRDRTFEVNASNLIVRHIHSRMGNTGIAVDAVEITSGSNTIIDHCSSSWSTDELLSVHQGASSTNLTVQWSIMAEALHNAGHSYGSLIRPGIDSNISWYHNLYADNYSRNPRVGYDDDADNEKVMLDFRNNVIYNWVDQAGYTEADGGGTVKANYVGNYAILGPSGTKKYIFNGKDVPYPNLQVYQSGNKRDTDKDGILDGADNGWSMFDNMDDPSTHMTSEFPMGAGYPAVATMDANTALVSVLGSAGAFPWNRDSVDANVMSQVLSYGTAGTLYYSVADAGGWPSYPSGTVPTDTDSDGMSNTWEIARGLDPSVANNNGDDDADGYTDLEEYLMWLAPIPAPRAIVWANVGGTAGRYEVITNWDIPWQPTLADQVQINAGKATVGYRHQEAGTLTVANTASSNAELAVTAGSLAIANRLILGNATGARGTASVTGGTLRTGKAIVLASAASSTGVLKVAKGADVLVGGLTINTGSGRFTKVGLEIASDGSSLIRTTATSTLGGVMDVQSLDGFRPREGDKLGVMYSTDPNGVHYTGNFSTFTSNITRGLPGSSAFGGAASGPIYELTFLGYTSGDANGDHKVDGSDLALMGGAWMKTGQTWGTCEFTGDPNALVDGSDLALMGGNWMWTLPGGAPLAIPEPASVALLALGAVGLVRRRR